MKATLHFDLPDDQHEFDLAAAAPELLSALRAVVEHVRRRLKYGDDLTTEARAELEEVRLVLDEEDALDLVYKL